MASVLTDAINTLAAECDRIILTGHSTGAGVAALLFLRYLKHGAFASIILSCITAPPVVSNPVTTPIPHPSATFLSVVNENDPVPRTDMSYISSLADLYAGYASGIATLSEWSPPTPDLHIPKESTIVLLQPTQENEEMRAKMHEIDIVQYEKPVALVAEMHRIQCHILDLTYFVWYYTSDMVALALDL
ncbi:hypothetical protein ST47_g8335 [Ascochyta rabiei]|uniref:Fungal lipase-type domain-containing protein n=1 Tax=Didymella rabiei TaxID=5454 RepID=A0A162ZC82_DIDRA|nr:hypothetical protein ST47_g8335 [Ascochyta rabiei]